VFRDAAGAIVFGGQQLATRNPARQHLATGLSANDLEHAFGIPEPDDLVQIVSALVALELLDRFPSLSSVSSRAGMTRRTLQRHLLMRGARFSEVLREVLQRHAFRLLRTSDQTVTEIATLLGYNDAAHFSRAFERWTGMSPSRWRAGICADREAGRGH
jgi:AraC-like DNA-binding protein